MATDMGRGIMAPDSNDPISTTGVSEMRTLGATTASAISSLDTRVEGELAERVRRDEAEQYGFEGPQGPQGPEGPPGEGDPGPPGPGGSIALEETDPGCFVDSEITWLQWDTSVGTVARAWNPDTETYHMIFGDTGWRELPLPERFISGRVLIKRENNTVTLRFESVEISGLENVTASDYLTSSGYIPNGFRPVKYEDRPVAFFVGSYAQYRGYMSIAQHSRLLYLASTADDNLGTGNARASGEMSWTTTPVWPTQLPGTPY